MVITEVYRKGERFEVITDQPFPSKINIGSHGYAVIYADGKKQLLHRYLMGAGAGELIDHKNENKLDNREENLRKSNKSLNAANKSGRKGYTKHGNKYKAQVFKDGKNIHIGLFDTPEAAQEAHKEAHKRLYGEHSPY